MKWYCDLCHRLRLPGDVACSTCCGFRPAFGRRRSKAPSA